MTNIVRVEDYCIGLLDADKIVRQKSAVALKGLGENVIPILEKIVLSQCQLLLPKLKKILLQTY